jgi:hypothetical protein
MSPAMMKHEMSTMDTKEDAKGMRTTMKARPPGNLLAMKSKAKAKGGKSRK